MKNQKKDSVSTAELQELVQKRTVFFDGAMGSSLLAEDVFAGKKTGSEKDCPELLNLTNPEIVKKIHNLFCEAGCDIIETNSFGAAPHTLSSHGLESKTYELNKAAALIANEAAENADHPVFVSGSIGPGSKLPSLGQAKPEELEESFFSQAYALLEGEVDLFQIETCQDILQAKSAYFGIKKAQEMLSTEKPIIVQFTLGRNLKTVLGSDIETIITAFSRFNLFALGLNCGTGPDDMRKSLEILSRESPFYISVLPNAGMPSNVNGTLVYNQPPEKYAEKVSSFVSDFGVEFVGGCCGTNPEHISRLVEKTTDKTQKPRNRKTFIPFFSSMYRTEHMISEPPPLIIGERANATGSAKFRKALKSGNIETMMDIIISQEKERAHLIDISVASTGRNELEDIDKIIHKVNREMTAPLCIDSTNPEVIEHALKNYGGRALINSINLENHGKSAVKIIQIARKYGASIIGLTIDDEGMAETAEKKLKIAEKIVSIAEKHGMNRRDIFIDPLTFSLGSGDRNLYTAGIETLKAVFLIKKNIPDISVMLGVSNVSYGLSPGIRRRLNVVFLYHAVKRGLDAAIFHPGKLIPLSRIPEKERKLFNDLIFNKRSSDYDPLEEIITFYSSSEKKSSEWDNMSEDFSSEEKLENAVVEGRKKNLKDIISELVKKHDPVLIIENLLLPTMKKVGELFGAGDLQLPFVLKSAEVMKTAVSILEPEIKHRDTRKKSLFLIATVKGDVHDIGKNLTSIILSSNGYEVIDAGIDVDTFDLMEMIKKYSPDFVGLSALLVKSTLEMVDVVKAFNLKNITVPIICGGAALDNSFVENKLAPIYKGKVFYAPDAFRAISFMSNYTEKNTALKSTENSKKLSRHKKTDKKTVAEKAKIFIKPFTETKILKPEPFEIIRNIHKNTLFKSRWKLNNEEEALKTFNRLASIAAEKINPRGIYGYVSLKESRFNFPREKEKPFRSIVDYTGKDGIFGVFVVSAGSEKLTEYLKSLMAQNLYSDYFLMNQLFNETAETLARIVDQKMSFEAGAGIEKTRRYSPGFPSWPDITEQRKIFDLLKPEREGIKLMESCEIVPEQSVSGIVVFNPKASYFSV